jgi:hypothetical protein
MIGDSPVGRSSDPQAPTLVSQSTQQQRPPPQHQQPLPNSNHFLFCNDNSPGFCIHGLHVAEAPHLDSSIAFKVTLRVTSRDIESVESARLGGMVGRLQAGEAAGGEEGEPVWRRSTCHVVRWVTSSNISVGTPNECRPLFSISRTTSSNSGRSR